MTETNGEEVTVTIPELSLTLLSPPSFSGTRGPSPKPSSLFSLRLAGWDQHSWKRVSPDVAIVGGIEHVSADVLEHVLGRATVAGIEDLHVAQDRTVEDCEDRGLGLTGSPQGKRAACTALPSERTWLHSPSASSEPITTLPCSPLLSRRGT